MRRLSARRMLGARYLDQSGRNFANSIPDLKFDIKEVLVAGDRVIVRGEVTGRPPASCSVSPQRQELPDHGNRYSDRPRREDRQDLPHGELAERAWAASRAEVTLEREAEGTLENVATRDDPVSADVLTTRVADGIAVLAKLSLGGGAVTKSISAGFVETMPFGDVGPAGMVITVGNTVSI